MIKMLIKTFVFASTFNYAALTRRGFKEIFDMTADDMIEAVIGVENFKKRHEDIGKNIYKNRSEAMMELFRKSEILNNVSLHSTTTSPRRDVVTPRLPPKRPPPNIDQVKDRMRKLELLHLFKQNRTFVPDFERRTDDHEHITRRFDKHFKNFSTDQPTRKQSEHLQQHGQADVHYNEYYEIKTTSWLKSWHAWYYGIQDTRLKTNRLNKIKVIAMMSQFIYMARYKIAAITDLRNKYRKHIKYRIGYTFAVLRLVRSQQKTIFGTLKIYNDTLTNSMGHLAMYHKIVKLDVDIKDLVRNIARMGYQMRLQDDPHYYDDEEDPLVLPEGLS